jgi:hypothetical protein
MLNEQMPENVLWINTIEAEKLGISNGNTVTVSQNGYSETIKAKVTEMIHPEAVFVVHGFGHRLPVESRAYMKGLADNKFMKNGLDIWDPVGGGVALQETFCQSIQGMRGTTVSFFPFRHEWLRCRNRKAFAEFNAAYRKARDSLVQLKNMVHERYGRDAY